MAADRFVIFTGHHFKWMQDMQKYQCKKYEIEEKEVNGRIERDFKNRLKNINEILVRAVAKYPQREGLVAGDRRLTFSRLDEISNRIAACLQNTYGVQKGDRVALLIGVGLDFPLAFFALMKLGAIAVPLNTRFKGEELAFEIDNSQSSLLIMDEEFWPTFEPVKAKRNTLKQVFVISVSPPRGTLPFSYLLDADPQDLKMADVDEKDTATIMYTSGTTGYPKGAMHTHRGIIIANMLIDDFLDIDPEKDRIVCAVPLFHSIGTIMSMMESVYTGIPCVYLRNYHTEDLMGTIQDEEITLIIHVPTVIWLMANHPKFDQYDLKSLRIAFIGGAAKSTELINQIRQRMPWLKICEAFGMTETHTMDCLLSGGDIERKISSVGQGVPVEELRIVDGAGKECLPGAPGELLLRGPKIITGYWNNPEATRTAIVDGWLHTGDVAKIDAEGFVSILDRIKDMIIRGGENIYSVEVENVLYRHPAVLEAAVIGVPNAVMGEEVKAFVILKEAHNVSEGEVQDFCQTLLADYKVPKYIEFIESLPRSPAGKILKKKLRDLQIA
jgi:acyl-CoA synthetase (AMP-forming)/AMP-acid ligase II